METEPNEKKAKWHGRVASRVNQGVFYFQPRTEPQSKTVGSYGEEIGGFFTFPAAIIPFLRPMSRKSSAGAGKQKATIDLWEGDNDTAVSRPLPIRTSDDWYIDAEMAPEDRNGPRRRIYQPKRPNQRPAVMVPHAGQSFNPDDVNHQLALLKATNALERKQLEDAKFQKMLSQKGDGSYKGNLSSDKTWEDEAVARPTPLSSSGRDAKQRNNVAKSASPAAGLLATRARAALATATTSDLPAGDGDPPVENEVAAAVSATAAGVAKNSGIGNEKKKNKKKKAKKGNKIEVAKGIRRQRVHRRHPQRITSGDVAELPDVVSDLTERQARLDKLRKARRKRKAAGMDIKAFGRYHHQPLVIDVAASDARVSTLRHMKSSVNIHPALDRIKSLEERNLIPAKMRHKYHLRKDPMPLGDVMIRKETMGLMPEV